MYGRKLENANVYDRIVPHPPVVNERADSARFRRDDRGRFARGSRRIAAWLQTRRENARAGRGDTATNVTTERRRPAQLEGDFRGDLADRRTETGPRRKSKSDVALPNSL